MMYKKLIPCIFIYNGKAVKWFDNKEIVTEDIVGLAKRYSEMGADQLIVFDLSDTDKEHDNAINFMKKINRIIRIPMIAGGNVRREEDVKKILYAGAKQAIVDLSKAYSQDVLEKSSKRFGKEKIAVSLNDFDKLYKCQRMIEEFASEIVFMHRPDINSVMNITSIPTIILTDVMEENEVFRILKFEGIEGISGKYVSQLGFDLLGFKAMSVATLKF